MSSKINGGDKITRERGTEFKVDLIYLGLHRSRSVQSAGMRYIEEIKGGKKHSFDNPRNGMPDK